MAHPIELAPGWPKDELVTARESRRSSEEPGKRNSRDEYGKMFH
jgi:hypothetical protein